MAAQVEQNLQHLGSQQVCGAGETLYRMLRARPSHPPPRLFTPPSTLDIYRQELGPGQQPGLTLSFTWPELLSRRFKRYSSRH